MNHKTFFIYLAIMAISTYLIRTIPFVLIKNQIENRFIRSFLHYIPYAVLTAMTIPAIFNATSSIISAVAGFVVAVILAYKGKSLTVVAMVSCLVVFLTELIII
ncbi:MAG: AzlD domain-containing protein [Eubacterium sp.]|nr:AzlD domain-containing protein [Eubacterium sp.]